MRKRKNKGLKGTEKGEKREREAWEGQTKEEVKHGTFGTITG